MIAIYTATIYIDTNALLLPVNKDPVRTSNLAFWSQVSFLRLVLPPPRNLQLAAKPLQASRNKTVVAASPTESETQAAERIIKALASSSVYFDYNKFTVKTEFQDFVEEKFLDLMKSNPKLVFVLEGHADERGTAEYNLAC